MSEYAKIKVRNLVLCSFRNYLDADVVSLFFTKNDLVETPDFCEDPNDEDSAKYTKYEYKTTVQKAKERFDALGYGIRKLNSMFDSCMSYAIDYSGLLYHLHCDYKDIEVKASERMKKYNVTFQKWKNAMNKIISYELEHGCVAWIQSSTLDKDIGISTECDKVIFYAQKKYNSPSYYAIDTGYISSAYIYRLILEYCSPDDEIVLDFSYLQYWSEDCILEGKKAAESNEKTIVLVEGTSDKDILEFAIKHIYPHLADLFYFMDFDDSRGGKRDGGTTYVIKNLKTFYFSKIKAQFIAIFDNDAEGYQSKCNLLNSIQQWPDNFRILLYPDNKLFTSYPTIAPNGTIVNDNIIKKACSIELYLPDDLIKQNNQYYPIEWEARKEVKNENGNTEYLYQGIISHKNDIKDSFHALKRDIESDRIPFISEDWERLKSILDTIVFAFA